MASKIYNRATGNLSINSGGDAVGNYIQFENGVKLYALTTAVTADTTVTTAVAGSLATTSNATGRGTMFRSDGAKWQLQA